MGSGEVAGAGRPATSPEQPIGHVQAARLAHATRQAVDKLACSKATRVSAGGTVRALLAVPARPPNLLTDSGRASACLRGPTYSRNLAGWMLRARCVAFGSGYGATGGSAA